MRDTARRLPTREFGVDIVDGVEAVDGLSWWGGTAGFGCPVHEVHFVRSVRLPSQVLPAIAAQHLPQFNRKWKHDHRPLAKS